MNGEITYAILCADGLARGEYWSVIHGWLDGIGDSFDSTERAHTPLPPGGVWVCGHCGQGDPLHPGHVCR